MEKDTKKVNKKVNIDDLEEKDLIIDDFGFLLKETQETKQQQNKKG